MLNTQQSGMTLLECLLVVALMALLITAALPAGHTVLTRHRVRARTPVDVLGHTAGRDDRA